MKELDPHKIDKPEIENVRQVVKHEQTHTLRPYPGHKTWELDLSDAMIREAKIEEEQIVVGQHPVFGIMTKTVKKVVRKDGCRYETALNYKSAARKFQKWAATQKLLIALQKEEQK